MLACCSRRCSTHRVKAGTSYTSWAKQIWTQKLKLGKTEACRGRTPRHILRFFTLFLFRGYIFSARERAECNETPAAQIAMGTHHHSQRSHRARAAGHYRADTA